MSCCVIWRANSGFPITYWIARRFWPARRSNEPWSCVANSMNPLGPAIASIFALAPSVSPPAASVWYTPGSNRPHCPSNALVTSSKGFPDATPPWSTEMRVVFISLSSWRLVAKPPKAKTPPSTAAHTATKKASTAQRRGIGIFPPLSLVGDSVAISVRPGRRALDLLTVSGAAVDHAVRPVLEAQEVQRVVGVVPPGPCRRRGEAQDRAFLHVDALAVHEELPPATHDDVNLVILPVPVQEGDALAGRDHVQRHLQARRPQELPQEQFAPGWPWDFRRVHVKLRPSLHRAGVETGEVGAPNRLVVRHRPPPFRTETRRQRPPLRREALTEGHQQFRRPLDADSPAEQGPQQAPLFCQEAQPRLAVGGHTQVGLALVAVTDLHGAVPDRHGRLLRLLAGEREVVD